MSLFSALKRNSRLALRGNWGKAIVAMLVTVGASMLLGVLRTVAVDLFIDPADLDPAFALQYGFNAYFFERFAMATLKESLIYLVFLLVGLLILAPLALGTRRWYYELVKGNHLSIFEIFHYFESRKGYTRALWFEVSLTIRLLLWSILFFLVPCGVLGASLMVIAQGEAATRTMLAMASVGLLLAGVLFLLALVFFLVVVNRYLIAPYLLCEDDGLTVRGAIRASVSQTAGYRFSLFWYQLSFVGWFLLCGLLFPALYVIPYFNMSITMYARYIIEKARYAPPSPTREFDPGCPQPPAEDAVSGSSVWMEKEPLGAEGAGTGEGFAFPQSRYAPGEEPSQPEADMGEAAEEEMPPPEEIPPLP